METGAHNDILNTSQLSFVGDFDSQVMEILTRVRLTRAEVENLQYLLDDLHRALCRIWPFCQVHPFGSIVTGLGIRTSDIDCYIQLPPGGTSGKAETIKQARNILQSSPQIFAELQAITTAKVPILKFIHKPTGFNCDINFSSLSGVQNSKLVAFLLGQDARALPLAIIIKYWSKVYSFTGTNLMPNYALTMLVIFYLQVKSILPSVAELQRSINPEFVENWNTAFDHNIAYVPDNAESLYELLGGFFAFYKDFDYEHLVVSPFIGYPITKQSFADLNKLPNEFDLYKQHVMNDACEPIRLDSSLCIQDPFEHSRNCSVAVFGKLFSNIQAHFDLAVSMFNEKQSKDFLRELFTNIIHAPKEKSHFRRHRNDAYNLMKINSKIKQKQKRQQTRRYLNRQRGNMHYRKFAK